MNYEAKLEALNVLGDCSLVMRTPGDWYVGQPIVNGITSKEHQGTVEGVYGNGVDPEEAVLAHWEHLVSQIPDDYWISTSRGRFRWNKFMWKELV